jgi:transcriptional regulator with XRE-family HTH domain
MRLSMRKTDATLRKFGQAVRTRRAQLGISQEELAARADLDRTYIGGIERGERNVALLNIVRIADALGVAVTSLVKDIP